MRNCFLACLGLLLVGLAMPVFGRMPAISELPKGNDDPVFNVGAILATPLNPRTLTTKTEDGIVTEEVMFHAEKDGDNDVEIFGIFAYPEGGKNLPAFVWNQGGLAQASPYWPRFGAKRGYAVLCIDFPMPGYRSTGKYNIVSNIILGDDPRQAPIYHGAVALLKAVSYLESRADVVDRNRIGMAGSSWGGFYTTMMVGIDPRLKAGSSMFGSGGLHLGCSWFGGAPKDKDWAARWATTLDPAFRLPRTKTPMNWCATTNDNFYWMPGLMESYARAGGPKHLALLPNWDHALNPQLDEEVFAFLDHHLQGKPALNSVSPLLVARAEQGLAATWTITGPRAIQSAELHISYGDAGNWRNRAWTTLPAEMRGTVCTVALPAAPLPYFISGAVIDADGFVTSTPLLRVDPAQYGLAKPAVLAFDGCAAWGDFEEPQMKGYIALHGYACPPRVAGGHTGAQAAVIRGTVKLPPVRYVAGIPQRVRCVLKAEQPTEVTLTFTQTADGAKYAATATVTAGAGWTPAELAILPPAGDDTHAALTMTVPNNAKVLLDAVTLTADAP